MNSNKHIQLFRPVYHNIDQITKSIADSLESGWTGNGPKTKLLEEKIAEYLGCKNVIMLNSGTAALHLAVRNTFDHTKKYVITTPNTFVATNMVLLYEGFTPIFADIDEYGNLDINSSWEIKTQKYRDEIAGTVMVHYSGATIRGQFNDCHFWPIIEDCAHAFSAKYYTGEKIGNREKNVCCFSNHAVKPFPINEGGFITTNDDELATKIRKQAWFGIDRSTFDRSKDRGYKWEYNIDEIGYKYHYNDIQACIGLEQLKYVDEDHERRIEVAQRYSQNLQGENIRFSPINRNYSYHFMPIFVKNNKKFIEKMSGYNIECGMHYKMNYHYPIFDKAIVYRNTNAEKFEETEVTLPFGLHLSNDDIDYVSECALKIEREIKND